MKLILFFVFKILRNLTLVLQFILPSQVLVWKSNFDSAEWSDGVSLQHKSTSKLHSLQAPPASSTAHHTFNSHPSVHHRQVSSDSWQQICLAAPFRSSNVCISFTPLHKSLVIQSNTTYISYHIHEHQPPPQLFLSSRGKRIAPICLF